MKSLISKAPFPDFPGVQGGDPRVTAHPLGSFQPWSWVRPYQSQPFLRPHTDLASVHPGPSSLLSAVIQSRAANSCSPGTPQRTQHAQHCPGSPIGHRSSVHPSPALSPCCQLCPKIPSPISSLVFSFEYKLGVKSILSQR